MIGQSCYLLLLIAVYSSTALPNDTVSYHGHKVFKILIQAEQELQHILGLQDLHELDIWHLPKTLNDSLVVRVSPWKQEKFLEEIKRLGSDVTSWIENVQALLTEETSVQHDHIVQKRSTRASPLNLDQYHTYQGIMSYLASMPQIGTFRSGVRAIFQEIGSSYQGNEIGLIELTNGVPNKKVVFIDGGIHAREWIAPATVLCLIDQLTNNPDHDPDVAELVNTFDFHIAPLVNPDGYIHTQTDRMWRKNRKPSHVKTGCVGVDLNRNFPYHWNPSIGGSTNPCSETFSGETEASEVETQRLMDRFRAHGSSTKVYLTFHAYGQYWLYPWGYTRYLPADWRNLDTAAKKAASAIRKTHGKRFSVGSSTRVLYSAAGGSDDYAKGVHNVTYSYTVELRDTGYHGFLLPANQIQATCQETWAGVKALLQQVKVNEGL